MRHRLDILRSHFLKSGSVAKWWTLVPMARFAAMFRNTHQIITAWPPGPIKLLPRVALFMHFDRGGRVSSPVLSYISDLAANGFSVVFVTNSGKLTAAANASLQAICAVVLVRHNCGYDFGAWAETIERLDLPARNTRELIIMNDSMYGPLRNLDNVLARLDYTQADIWGLTESWQQRYHLQSYFLAFGQQALQSPAFLQFWRQVKPVPSKFSSSGSMKSDSPAR